MNNNFEFIRIFEQRLREYTGAPYVALVDSCTNAIFLSLLVKKIVNQEIVVPRRTYVSVYNSIIHSGNSIKVEDIPWEEKYQLGDTGIWDCAVGFRENMYVPGQMMCLSFQQKKAIKIGKGGAILLDDKDMYEKIRRLAYDGRDYMVDFRKDTISLGGYHMNMITDDAAKGILLLNQYTFKESDIGNYMNYPDFDFYK